ncbi:MAG: hypothetical protein JNM63_10550 [Spirochaetia bacterium]|nr:hypothetical protein [Spirochaetia bacterium]
MILPGDTVVRSYWSTYYDPVSAVKTITGYGDYVVPFTLSTSVSEQTLKRTEFKPNAGRLTLKNSSSKEISRILAKGAQGAIYMGDDEVYDQAVTNKGNTFKGANTNGLKVGSSSTKPVSAGTNYLYFYFTADEVYKGSNYYIIAPIIVPLSGTTNFEFKDDTAFTVAL